MSNPKKYIAGVVLVGVFTSGFALGYLSALLVVPDVTPYLVVESELPSEPKSFVPSKLTATTSSAVKTVPGVGITLDLSTLTTGQRTLLGSLGVATDSITLTPQMIACVEAKIASERMIAIINGDTPSFLEGAKLMTCYSAG
jgi:hypothetical protein